MKYLTIIDNFDKENDKFHQRFDSVLESQNSRLKWDYIHYSSLSNPDIYAKALKSDGILLTGSYNHVSDPETLKKYYHEQRLIKEFIDPILGICFGHQLIGVTYGFRSGRMDHPDGDIEEEKTLHLHISPKFLLFPRDIITVYETHHQELKYESGFDKIFQNHASSPACKIQMISHRELPVFGIQFHPENPTSQEALADGKELISNFIDLL